MAVSFQAGDLVQRVVKPGSVGIVQKIRVETVRSSLRAGSSEGPGITVTVLWDNGTISHFIPDGLEKIVH